MTCDGLMKRSECNHLEEGPCLRRPRCSGSLLVCYRNTCTANVLALGINCPLPLETWRVHNTVFHYLRRKLPTPPPAPAHPLQWPTVHGPVPRQSQSVRICVVVWCCVLCVVFDHGRNQNKTQHNTTPHDTTRHGTARHGTTRHDTARHGTARHDTARHGTARHHTTRHDTARHGTAPHDTTRHDTTRHDTTRHSTAHNSTQHQTTPHHSAPQRESRTMCQ